MAWAAHRGYFNELWVYEAVKFGYAGPGSDSIEFTHEELTLAEFAPLLTEAKVSSSSFI